MKSSCIFVILSVLLAVLCSNGGVTAAVTELNAESKCPVKIGSLMPIKDWPWGYDTMLSFRVALEMWNEDNPTSPMVMEAVLKSTSSPVSESDAGVATIAAFSMIDDVVGIVGPCYSSTAQPVAQLSKIFNIPLVSPSATSPTLSDKSNFPTFFRTAPSDAFQGTAMIGLLKKYNWKKFAAVACNGPYCVNGNQVLVDKASAQNITVTFIGSYPRETQDEALITEMLQNVKDTGVRILTVFGLAAELPVLFRVGAKLDMIDGWVWILSDSLAGNPWGELSTDGVNWTGALSVVPKGGSGAVFERFKAKFEELNTEAFMQSDQYTPEGGWVPAGFPPLQKDIDFYGTSNFDNYAHYSFDAGKAITFATAAILDKLGKHPCNTDMADYRELLNQELKTTFFEGATGQVFFDQFQDRIGGYEIYSLDHSSSVMEDRGWKTIGLWTELGGIALDDDENTPVWLGNSGKGLAQAPINPPIVVTCKSGSARLRQTDGSYTCVECQEGTYAFGLNSPTCNKCPSGGVCKGTSITASADYWQNKATLPLEVANTLDYSDSSIIVPEFFRCNDESCCVNGGCGPDPTGLDREVCNGCEITDELRCEKGREGLMCASCISGYAEWGNTCIDCTDPEGGGWIVFVIFVVFLLVWVLCFESKSDLEHEEGDKIPIDVVGAEEAPPAATGGVLRRMSRQFQKRFKVYYSIMGVLVRMFIEYVQLLGLVIKVNYMEDVLPWFYISLSFIISSTSDGEPQCLFSISPVGRAMLGAMLICLVYTQLLFAAGVSWCFQTFISKPEGGACTRRYRTGFWRLSFFCFPIFLVYELNLLACVDVDGTSVVVSFPGVECWTSDHTTAVVLFGLFCCFFVGFIPVWLVYVLSEKRKDQHPRLHGMLSAMFKPHVSSWYGIFAFVRRCAAFLARVVFVENIKLQKSVIMLIVASFLVMQVMYRPYRRALLNYIQIMLLSCLILSCALQLADTNQNRFDDSTADPYTTFKDVMVTLIMFAPVAGVPYLARLERNYLDSRKSKDAPKQLSAISEADDLETDPLTGEAAPLDVPEYFFTFDNEDEEVAA
jgi:ABC-type branched-subunit amino acid transport system substrate-binding protein